MISATAMTMNALILLGQATGNKLSPPASAAVLMALLGIALLGMLLVVVILLGGNWARKQGSYRRGPVVPPDRALLAQRSNAVDASIAKENDADSQAAVDTVREPPNNRDETVS